MNSSTARVHLQIPRDNPLNVPSRARYDGHTIAFCVRTSSWRNSRSSLLYADGSVDIRRDSGGAKIDTNLFISRSCVWRLPAEILRSVDQESFIFSTRSCSRIKDTRGCRTAIIVAPIARRRVTTRMIFGDKIVLLAARAFMGARCWVSMLMGDMGLMSMVLGVPLGRVSLSLRETWVAALYTVKVRS